MTPDVTTDHGYARDLEVDWLVTGSGAAGMTSAVIAHDLGATTLIVEKSPLYGGSTAMSGGAIWVPANHLMAKLGEHDSREDAARYLMGITEGQADPLLVDAYLDAAPEMVLYLEAHSRVRFAAVEGYPDYYPEREGGRFGARTIEPLPFDALELGDEFRLQRPFSERSFLLGMISMTALEVKTMLAGGWPMYRLLLRQLLAWVIHWRARLRLGMKTSRLTLGRSLAARLRRSLLDRAVPLWLDAPLRELVRDDDGRVVGGVVERDGARLRIHARKGVLLASGGFEQNEALRHHHQPSPTGTQWALGADSNTGDAVALGGALGADFRLMEDAWWCPVFKVPGEAAPFISVVEKGMPGSMMVNARGERFMNEAAPYNDMVKSMYAAHSDESPAIPCYMVFDADFRQKHSCGPVKPGYMQPDHRLPPELKAFLHRGETLAELAEELGMEAPRLEASIERFNGFARSGRDEDYHRGESAQDRYYSDPQVEPNSCLAPIAQAPFYAAAVYPGDLGTKGGLRTDRHARVLDPGGRPIAGLYAAGNCAASMMEHTYPGAGGTIGPAMTFGWLASQHAL
ncbi:MAG: FAD-binding protein, partial [Deltaproteobacteria bacterium]|nr:FAD-binding protein [Deltaproteobacteria bacterium]